MVKKGTFTFNKNIVLDETSIRDLNSLLSDFCSRIEYQVITKNNDNIVFNSLEELLLYDNFKKGKIKKLEFVGKINSIIVFVLNLHSKRHSPPYVIGTYSFNNLNMETLFISSLNKFFEKRVECYYHHCVSSIVLGLSMFIGSFYLILRNELFDYTSMISIAFYLVLIYTFIENIVLKYLFPPVVFLWGKELDVHKTRTDIRKNIVWVIIVPTIMAALSAFF